MMDVTQSSIGFDHYLQIDSRKLRTINEENVVRSSIFQNPSFWSSQTEKDGINVSSYGCDHYDDTRISLCKQNGFGRLHMKVTKDGTLQYSYKESPKVPIKTMDFKAGESIQLTILLDTDCFVEFKPH